MKLTYKILKPKLIVAGLLAPLLLAFSWAWVTPATVAADAKSDICSGVGIATSDACGSTSDLTPIVRNIINIMSILIGLVSVIMIIYGGFRYVISGGDSGKIGDAKNTIIYALIGLVIVGLAQFLVQFVLKTVTTPPPK